MKMIFNGHIFISYCKAHTLVPACPRTRRTTKEREKSSVFSSFFSRAQPFLISLCVQYFYCHLPLSVCAVRAANETDRRNSLFYFFFILPSRSLASSVRLSHPCIVFVSNTTSQFILSLFIPICCFVFIVWFLANLIFAFSPT